MASYETPPNRSFVRMSRPHDFLYDPNYILPSRENFLNDAAFRTKSGARVKIKSMYKTMFSELKSDRRLEPCLTLQPNNLENFMPQYYIGGVPVMPMDTGPLPLPRQVDDVTGADRAKYAIRYGQQTYRLHHEAFNFNKLIPEEKKKILQTQKTRRSGYISRGMQTDFRETETQTDPYSPPYKLTTPGAYPKVLALIKLTWGKGLPFTLEDIVIIERALSRRLLEHTNRIDEDDKGFENRIKLMEELEAQQWSDREKELEKVLQLKMEITSKLILEYSGKIATEHTMRLERLQTVLKAKDVNHLGNVKRQYFRNLRKLERKYFEPKPSRKRDIIKDYTEFDSRVYAPLVRNGPSMDLLNPAPPFQFDLHRDFESFQYLTESKEFIRKELQFDLQAFKNRIKKCEPNAQDRRLDRKLEKVYAAFKDPHLMKRGNPYDQLEEAATSSASAKNQGPIVELEGEYEEGVRKAHIITVEKIMKGQLIQKIIRDEMEENMEELLGMKRMFDMDPNCQRLEEGQMQKLMSMKRQNEAEAARDSVVKEVVGNLEGETLNKMLEFLEKEMIRLIDERKIHALILLAERERRRKEAVEAGRRHFEEENRRASDEIFKQVVGIHQGTVDIYLEEAYIECSDRTADEAARILVRNMATTINEAAYAVPEDIGDYEKEELAAELVYGFLIPELSRLCHKETLKTTKDRYKKAASQVIDAIFSAHDVAKQIIETHVPPLAKAHNIEGWAAADGTVSVMDELIKQAVLDTMVVEDEMAAALMAEIAEHEAEMEAMAEEEEQEGVQPGTEEPSELSLATSKSVHFGEGIEIPPEPVESVTEMAEEEIEVPEDEEEAVEERIESPKDVKEEIEIPDFDYEEEMVETPREQLYLEPRLHVHDEVKARLAAKSLQLAFDTEPSQQIENLYGGLTQVIEDVFVEARRLIAPDPDQKEEVQPVIEDDSDDD